MTRCAPSSFSRPPSMPWINWYCREESSGYCLTWVCFNWCPSGCDSSFGKMLNTLFSGNVFCSGTPSSDNNSKKSVESCKICPGRHRKLHSYSFAVSAALQDGGFCWYVGTIWRSQIQKRLKVFTKVLCWNTQVFKSALGCVTQSAGTFRRVCVPPSETTSQSPC